LPGRFGRPSKIPYWPGVVLYVGGGLLFLVFGLCGLLRLWNR
jgi:hypothetical protein